MATAAAAKAAPVPVAGTIASSVVPLSVDETPVNVMVFLDGKSAADLQEDYGRRLTADEKAVNKAEKLAAQVGPRANIEAIGGRVSTSFHAIGNALRVRIPRNQLDAVRRVPGVVAIRPIVTHQRMNVTSVPRIGAPVAWTGPSGVHGEGVKIGIIDTGIDYTHKDFGGPGTVDAYNAALAVDTAAPDPALVGPSAPKVKGGIDLVGDDYDANDNTSVPVPDSNPLDCNSHGTHVAGTAAGFGVLESDHSTYTGPYDSSIYGTTMFHIGPGVAPKADLYAIRVFGCSGSTNVVSEALEWAVDNDMDVVNMSLGADYSPADSADSFASDAAMRAGVMVVSAAGNAGIGIPYIVGSPGDSTKGMAIAASPKFAAYPSANLALPAAGNDGARSIVAIDANGAPFTTQTLTVKVLKTGNNVSLGCDPMEYVNAGVTGKLVVVQRGTCARVARAIFGQQAGAAAVVMINNAATLPPYEGQITQDPDPPPFNFTVTIPFFGVKGLASSASSDGARLALRDGMSVTITNGTPLPTGTSTFSSSGPRTPDGMLKPDVTAPGESILSAGMGTGFDILNDSGTSMATPHITGTAALVIQAHPTWRTGAIKAAIINSGDPNALTPYVTRLNGTGEIAVPNAVNTQAYAYADSDMVHMSFGVQEFKRDLTVRGLVHVKNDGPTSATFNVSVTNQAGSPHTMTPSASRITVPSHGEKTFTATLTVPAATAGDSNPIGTDLAFRDVAGLITLTPTSGNQNKGATLRVPYYLLPRVSSNISSSVSKLTGDPPTGTVTTTNKNSPIGSTADFYAWGLTGVNDGNGRFDVRAVGVQAFDAGPPVGQLIIFAVNTFRPWSTPVSDEFDISIDTNGDGEPEFILFDGDLGRLAGNPFNGQVASVIFNVATKKLTPEFLVTAASDSATMLLLVKAADLGLTADSPRFSYSVTGFDAFGTGGDPVPGVAKFNAFSSSITQGLFFGVDPNDSQAGDVSIDPTEFGLTPAKGLMIVTQDNANGPDEAQLVRVGF